MNESRANYKNDLKKAKDLKNTTNKTAREEKKAAEKNLKAALKSGQISKEDYRQERNNLNDDYKDKRRETNNNFKDTRTELKKQYKEDRHEEKEAKIRAKLDDWRSETIGDLDSIEGKVLRYIIDNPNEALAFLRGKIHTVNWQMKTMGGKVHWENIVAYKGWHIQENIHFHQWRILDPNMVRRLWDDGTNVAHAFKEMAEGDYSRTHFLGGFGYDNGHYDGKKEGYDIASKEYEEKLRRDAEYFLTQKNAYINQRDKYEDLINKLYDYISILDSSGVSKEIIDKWKKNYIDLTNLGK